MTENYSEGYARVRPEHVAEHRRLGPFDIVRFSQPAGEFPDPPADIYSFHMPMFCDGRGRVDFGAGVYQGPVRPGGLFLAPPGVECHYALDAPHDVVGIGVDAATIVALVREWAPSFNGDFGALHFGPWQDQTLLDSCLRTYWRSARAPDADFDGDTLLLQMASKLHERATDARPRPWRHRMAPHLRERLVAYVEAHLDGDLGLFTLASVRDLSPYHFARMFRLEMGMAPHAYVLDRRLARCRQLIRHTRCGLAEIAASTGFSSQAHMTSTFKKLTGRTPASWRPL